MDAVYDREGCIALIDEHAMFIDNAIADLAHPNAAFLADYWLPKIYDEVVDYAENLELDATEVLGEMAPRFAIGVSGKNGIWHLRKFRKKLLTLRDSIATPTATSKRYKPGACPICGAKLAVTSTRKTVRHLACTGKKCDYTGKKSM